MKTYIVLDKIFLKPIGTLVLKADEDKTNYADVILVDAKEV